MGYLGSLARHIGDAIAIHAVGIGLVIGFAIALIGARAAGDHRVERADDDTVHKAAARRLAGGDVTGVSGTGRRTGIGIGSRKERGQRDKSCRTQHRFDERSLQHFVLHW